MFKLGIITNSISQDIVHALDVAKQLGIRHVEIHSLWGKSIENLSDQEIRQVKEFITDRELEVSCVSSTVFLRCRLRPGEKIVWETSFISSEGDYAAHIKMLKRAIEMADILETPLIRCFGFWKEDEMTASSWQEIVQKFQEPVRMVEEAGMTLALENCPTLISQRQGQPANSSRKSLLLTSNSYGIRLTPTLPARLITWLAISRLRAKWLTFISRTSSLVRMERESM